MRLIRISDTGLRRLLRNSTQLLGGNAIQAIGWLLAVFVAARGLGVEQFGRLALVSSYCAVLSQLFSFQSAYAVIHVGAPALERSRMRALFSIIRAAWRLDAGAAVAGALVAVGGIGLAMHLGLLHPDTAIAALIFSVAVGASAVGAPTAALRLFDRYDAFVVQSAIGGLARVGFTVAAYVGAGELVAFAVAWAAAHVAGNAALWGLAWREMRRRSPPARLFRFRKTLRMFPDFWPFLLSTNLSAMVRGIREADTLLVGSLLDATGAGLFRIARQFGTALSRVVDPVFHAIYPDLATVNERSGPRAVAQLMRRAALSLGAVCGAAVLAFLLAGQPLVTLAGDAFVNSYGAALWCVTGAALWGGCQSFAAALLVWKRHRAILRLNVAVTACYVTTIIGLAPSLGATGAGMANALMFLLWGAGAVIMANREARMQEQALAGAQDLAAPRRQAAPERPAE